MRSQDAEPVGPVRVGSVDPDEDPGPTTLITDHEFDPWRYDSGKVVCKHWDPAHPTRSICDRPADEHAQVPERVEEGDGGS